MESKKRFSFKITFTRTQTDTLEKISVKPNFLSQISAVVLKLAYVSELREGIDGRNRALKKIKGYAKKILNEKKLLSDFDLYRFRSFNLEEFEKNISSLEIFNKSDLSCKDNALFAIAYILRKNGYPINLSPTKRELGAFLTTAEIVFHAAGIHATPESIEKAARRAGIESGSSQVPYQITMLPLLFSGWNAECSYATSNGCFSATYNYIKI